MFARVSKLILLLFNYEGLKMITLKLDLPCQIQVQPELPDGDGQPLTA
jgi:hypothetical protein